MKVFLLLAALALTGCDTLAKRVTHLHVGIGLLDVQPDGEELEGTINLDADFARQKK